ncbi:MAG TPA: phosphoribosylamine--glycine ligase [Terriglobia bacterium]|nr:phosphoribosylamine--glycine ligase [Terriglobia bacterium]
MNILVLGSGGREHSLVWKLRESQLTDEIFCAPGNAGIAQTAECFPVDLTDPSAILQLAGELKADLTVAGPEAPLVAGVVDEFEAAGRTILGPTKMAAQLEGSKIFAKEFMKRHAIPTARFAVVEDYSSGEKAVAEFGLPVVIKADGLAAGKGVVVARTHDEAVKALSDFMVRKSLGGAGERVVIEECLLGEELSFIILAGKRGWLPLVPTQDHKAVFDNDLGPNTGGMGAYSEDSILPERLGQRIIREVIEPTLAGMAADGMPYYGFLYCGLMITAEGPKVLEYNVRLGDPETQPIMMRLRSDLCEILMASLEGQLTGVGARWSPNPSVCVVLASRGYPGKSETGRELKGIESAESLGGVKVFHAGTVFHDHQLLTSGGRVLGVAATAEDLPTTIEQAYAAVSKVHFDGMHFRRDVGAKGLRRLKVTGEIRHPDNQAGNPPPA